MNPKNLLISRRPSLRLGTYLDILFTQHPAPTSFCLYWIFVVEWISRRFLFFSFLFIIWRFWGFSFSVCMNLYVLGLWNCTYSLLLLLSLLLVLRGMIVATRLEILCNHEFKFIGFAILLLLLDWWVTICGLHFFFYILFPILMGLGEGGMLNNVVIVLIFIFLACYLEILVLCEFLLWNWGLYL